MSAYSISQENTILVVDDTPTNLQVLFDLLSEQGYRVAIAKNGETALQRVQSSEPNLILLDVMMPGIDGFETCQRLKANPGDSRYSSYFHDRPLRLGGSGQRAEPGCCRLHHQADSA